MAGLPSSGVARVAIEVPLRAILALAFLLVVAFVFAWLLLVSFDRHMLQGGFGTPDRLADAGCDFEGPPALLRAGEAGSRSMTLAVASGLPTDVRLPIVDPRGAQ